MFTASGAHDLASQIRLPAHGGCTWPVIGHVLQQLLTQLHVSDRALTRALTATMGAATGTARPLRSASRRASARLALHYLLLLFVAELVSSRSRRLLVGRQFLSDGCAEARGGRGSSDVATCDRRAR